MRYMKKANSVIFLLFASVLGYAQGTRQLDSLKYVLPEFKQGTVIFADKSMSSGLLNISPIDQSVYCIDSQDTLYVTGNPDIISVSADRRSFFKWKDAFVELVISDGGVGVGIIRVTSKVSNVKMGAYGMSSSTSSIQSYSVDASTGTLRSLIIDDPRNYSHKVTPCLFKSGKFFPVSKKSFEKLFPDKKEFIESVWAERGINIADVGAVIEFYKELGR